MYDAFIEFEELGLEDYIIDLELDIIAPIFPLKRHTAGDFARKPIVFHPKCNSDDRVFKKIINLKTTEKQNAEEEKKSTEKHLKEQIEKTVTQTLTTEVEKVFEKESERLVKETVIPIIESSQNTNITNRETTNNSSVFNSQKIENKNITQIVNQKLEESHSMTENMIIELEQSLNSVQQDFIVNHLDVINNNITKETKETKKELTEKIDHTKKYFEEFLNS